MSRLTACILQLVFLFGILAARAENTVVRFDIQRGTNALGAVDVELFDSEKPETVRNFLLYVRSGAYSNTFFHRCVPGFVVQGGGFMVTNLTSGSSFASYREVTNYGRLKNEFSTGATISNSFGTIAMAKIGNDPDSATSQWFFNLASNTNLDTQNGGFTVFGRILPTTNNSNTLAHFNGLSNAVGIVNLNTLLGTSYAVFNELPVAFANNRVPLYRELYSARISVLNETNTPGVAPPTVQIVVPGPNSTFTNQAVTVSGTAADDTGIARVVYRVGTNAAQGAFGTTNWQFSISPQPGLNPITVESIDWDGNRSAAAGVTFLYVAQVPLALEIRGSGQVVGGFNGKKLQVGNYYTLTAIPASGWIFHSWTGTFTSNVPAITFLVPTNATNISLTAKFVTEPLPRLAGSYQGLFRSRTTPSTTNSGSISLQLLQTGAFEGSIFHRGGTYNYTGQFDSSGHAIIQGEVGGVHRTIGLDLQKLDPQGLITGSFTDGQTEIRLERLASTNVYGIATGKYTFVIPPIAQSATDQLNPAGYGFGSCTINSMGLLTFSGRLGDNQTFSGTAPLTRLQHWPIYLNLLNGRGVLTGWLSYSTNGTANLDGALHWVKGFGGNDATYPAGFANQVLVLGSRYSQVSAGERVIDWAHGLASINGPFQIGISNIVKLTPENVLTTFGNNPGGTSWNLDPLTGMVTGSFTDPWTGTARTLRGVVLKRSNSILGQFVDRGTVGSLVITKAPFLVTQRVHSVTLPDVLAALKDGGYLRFATNVAVTFTEQLALPYDLALDADGHSVLFSGGGSTRLFRVATNRTLIAKGITFADGIATGTDGANINPPEPGNDGRGAGIINLGGVVALTNCVFTNFYVRGGIGGKDKQVGLVAGGGRGIGAAIYSQAGRVILDHCFLADNFAEGGTGSVDPMAPQRGCGSGAAVFSDGGECIVEASVFLRNVVSGGAARLNGTNVTRAGDAVGGALGVSAGRLQIANSEFRANSAYGRHSSTNNQTPGGAHGGAVFIETNVIATIDQSTFADNIAIGGHSAWGQPSGRARGGGIFNRGNLQVRRSTVEQNTVSTGTNGVPGNAAGGGMASLGSLVVDTSTFSYNSVGSNVLTNGWQSGGGALFCDGGSFMATNSTFAFNSVTGDSNAPGAGMMLISNSAVIVHGTVAFNSATGTNGAGIDQRASSVRLRSSIISSNTPRNFIGALTDDGYNISSDASATLTAIGSTNNVNPLLAPLSTNGGPTRTMALLVGSPARDRLPPNPTPVLPAADQRGVVRISGSRGDVGSVEIGTNEWPVIVSTPLGGRILWGSNFTFHVIANGVSPLSYAWLSNDIPILGATNSSLSFTNVQMVEPSILYRVIVSNQFGSLTSSVAQLTIDSAPQLHVHPGDVLTSPGAPANFAVVATGPSLSYTWLHNNVPVPGADGPILSIANAQGGMQGTYRVVITNFAGSTNSPVATLTFDSTALRFLQTPTNTTIFEGEAGTLSAVVEGQAPIAYTWLLGFTPIINATNEQLSFSPAAFSDQGQYRLAVTNAYLALTSAPVTVTVLRRPLLSIGVIGSNAVISCRGTPNRTHHLLQGTSVNAQAWTVLATNLAPASGTSTWTRPLIRTQNVFYRVVMP